MNSETSIVSMPASAPNTAETSHLSVCICNDVLDELRFNGSWARDQVACGLLLGHLVKNPAGEVQKVIVVGFLSSDHFHDIEAFTQFLLREWKNCQKQLEDFCPENHREEIELVGWFAAWPKDGAALGQQAKLLQNTFFTKPHHIVLWMTTPPRALTSPPAAIPPPSDDVQPLKTLTVATTATTRCLLRQDDDFIEQPFTILFPKDPQSTLPQ